MKKAFNITFVAVVVIVASVALYTPALSGKRAVGAVNPVIVRAEPDHAVDVGYKTLTVMTGYLYSAIFITKVTVGEKQMVIWPISAPLLRSTPNLIVNARPFQEGNDWIANTTLYIKNITDKPIAWAGIDIWFPETGNGSPGQPMALLPISLGRIPDADLPIIRTRSGKPLQIPATMKPLNLQPGQVIAVHLSGYMGRIRSLVENAMPLMMVTKLKVEVGTCYFEDGMRWGGGGYVVPDPAHPGGVNHMPSNFFPGDPRRYWRRGLQP